MVEAFHNAHRDLSARPRARPRFIRRHTSDSRQPPKKRIDPALLPPGAFAMKVSDYMGSFLVAQGVTHVFELVGG